MSFLVKYIYVKTSFPFCSCALLTSRVGRSVNRLTVYWAFLETLHFVFWWISFLILDWHRKHSTNILQIGCVERNDWNSYGFIVALLYEFLERKSGWWFTTRLTYWSDSKFWPKGVATFDEKHNSKSIMFEINALGARKFSKCC